MTAEVSDAPHHVPLAHLLFPHSSPGDGVTPRAHTPLPGAFSDTCRQHSLSQWGVGASTRMRQPAAVPDDSTCGCRKSGKNGVPTAPSRSLHSTPPLPHSHSCFFPLPASWNFLSNTLSVPQSSPQVLLLGEPKPKTSIENLVLNKLVGEFYGYLASFVKRCPVALKQFLRNTHGSLLIRGPGYSLDG